MLRHLAFALVFAAQTGMAASDWTLSPDALGPLRVGMSLQQVSAVVGEAFHVPPAGTDCTYVQPKAHPRYALMIVDGRLERIDLRGSTLRTSSGIAIGDPVAKVKAAYGSALAIEPHKYDPKGQTLTAFGESRSHAIRFETRHGNVSAIYAGAYEQVQYVEGCS